jgi:hypothetical protein
VSRPYPAALLANFDNVALDSFLPELVPDASMIEFQLIPFTSRMRNRDEEP